MLELKVGNIPFFFCHSSSKILAVRGFFVLAEYFPRTIRPTSRFWAPVICTCIALSLTAFKK